VNTVIKYGGHAREQMIDRGISTHEIEQALKQGSKTLQYPNKILYYFRYFVVVTKKINGDDFIITVKPRW
jgi:hypothetical protein